MAASDYGALIPAPSWYPSYLPKFYRAGNGQIHVYPLNSVPKYTNNDVLDLLLYYQTIIGYNRSDAATNGLLTGMARSAAWAAGGRNAAMWAAEALKSSASGDGSGNWASIPSYGAGIDAALESSLQNRYIQVNATQMPWLSSLQAKGGGIDLLTIPMSTDVEVPRPSAYPAYLPSLFISSGQPYQWPAGSMNTKPKIKNFKSSGYSQYTITPNDVAALMLYAQPTIYKGPTPYPANWYINDQVNGAMAFRFKIALAFTTGFTNSQEQAYGAVGDMMKAPVLDENPFASGFSLTMQSIIKYVISFFAGKIPGANSLTTIATTAANMGGAGITGSDVPPAGAFSAAVFAAADSMQKKMVADDQKKTFLIIGVAAAALAWWAHKEKYF